MSFTFVDSDGDDVKNVMQCQGCGHIQTERHFGDDEKCPLCFHHGIEKINTVSNESGMSEFQFRNLLSRLEEDCDGIGESTTDAIAEEFDDGDEFVSACKDAYESNEFDELTKISGIGKATAHKKIVLGMAEKQNF